MTDLERQLVEACRQGLVMRTAQTAYFKGRSREELVVAKAAESKFDSMVAAALEQARRWEA